MHKGLLLLAALPAAIEINSIGGVFFLAVRFLVACGAAFMAWLLLGPPVRGLYRMAFHKPMPGTAVGVSRLVGGVCVGLLIFFLMKGFGPGSGTGSDGKGGPPGVQGNGDG